MTSESEWTEEYRNELRRLDRSGATVRAIADELGRSEGDVANALAAIRRSDARQNADPSQLEWNGPDEEGDVQPPSGRPDDDPAAWVHSKGAL